MALTHVVMNKCWSQSTLLELCLWIAIAWHCGTMLHFYAMRGTWFMLHNICCLLMIVDETVGAKNCQPVDFDSTYSVRRCLCIDALSQVMSCHHVMNVSMHQCYKRCYIFAFLFHKSKYKWLPKSIWLFHVLCVLKFCKNLCTSFSVILLTYWQNDWICSSAGSEWVWFSVPLDAKWLILETFFPANVLTQYWRKQTSQNKGRHSPVNMKLLLHEINIEN